MIQLLEECDSNNWIDLERYWISQLKAWNFNLTNTAIGGVGAGTMSKETRKKISEANKGQIAWNKGVPCNPQTKIKLSKALSGRITSEETRKKISTKNKGRKMSESAKKKMSISQKGHPDYRSFEGKQNQIKSLSKSIIQLDKNLNVINIWPSAAEANRNLFINKSHINECCHSKRKTAGGFIWKFKN